MKKKILLLFDVDGTIANSGKKMDPEIQAFLQNLDPSGFEFGIVGGGELEKILFQINGFPFQYIFSECGCVFHQWNPNNQRYREMYTKTLQDHETYPHMEPLIRAALHFIAMEIKCPLSGKFVDRRQGLYYISLVGIQANDRERQEFIILDNLHSYRKRLLQILENLLPPNLDSKIDVKIGGHTGITILPKEWNKLQAVDSLPFENYHHVFYFGDKYEPEGNDYELLRYSAPNYTGVPVATIEDTRNFLRENFT